MCIDIGFFADIAKKALIWQGGHRMKQYIVELTSEERSQLHQIVTRGNTTGYRIKYAHILLKADQGKNGPGWSDPKIAEAFDCNLSTVYRLRKRLVEKGFDTVLRNPNTGKRKRSSVYCIRSLRPYHL